MITEVPQDLNKTLIAASDLSCFVDISVVANASPEDDKPASQDDSSSQRVSNKQTSPAVLNSLVSETVSKLKIVDNQPDRFAVDAPVSIKKRTFD